MSDGRYVSAIRFGQLRRLVLQRRLWRKAQRELRDDPPLSLAYRDPEKTWWYRLMAGIELSKSEGETK